MKLIRTTRQNAREAAAVLAALEQRGGAALDQVLPAVKRIVTDVRKGGDRALLRYAAKFDGLAGANALHVTREEMAAAWKALDLALRDALTAENDLIVLFVAAVAFMHFIADLWGYWEQYPERKRSVGIAVAVLAVATIVAGFFIIGTPAQARAYQFDEQKISDLQTIQSDIVSYWQQKWRLLLHLLHYLPANLLVPPPQQLVRVLLWVRCIC